jgi:hypothetical protein
MDRIVLLEVGIYRIGIGDEIRGVVVELGNVGHVLGSSR